MYFRAGHNKDDTPDEFVYLDFKTMRAYLLIYHLAVAFFVGWPAEWLRRFGKKHEKWILDEYNIELFKKRLDDI